MMIVPLTISKPPLISSFKSTYCSSLSLLDDFKRGQTRMGWIIIRVLCIASQEYKNEALMNMSTPYLAGMSYCTLPSRIFLGDIINMLGKVRVRFQQMIVRYMKLPLNACPHYGGQLRHFLYHSHLIRIRIYSHHAGAGGRSCSHGWNPAGYHVKTGSIVLVLLFIIVRAFFVEYR